MSVARSADRGRLGPPRAPRVPVRGPHLHVCRELDRLTDRFAAALGGLGVGPGEVAAIVLDSGPELFDRLPRGA